MITTGVLYRVSIHALFLITSILPAYSNEARNITDAANVAAGTNTNIEKIVYKPNNKISKQSVNSQSKTNSTTSSKDIMAKDSASDENRHEPVSGVTFDGQTLTFTAISNGCTRPDHFAIQHVIADNQCHINIERIQPDFCRRVPFPAEISLNWRLPDECESFEIIVDNPLLTAAGQKFPSTQDVKKVPTDTGSESGESDTQ